MIFGIGIDVVDMARLARVHDRWGERLERRLLGPAERAALPAGLAARRRRLAFAFAAKEALGKALGTGMRAPATWTQVGVRRDERGAPAYDFAAPLAAALAARGIAGAHLSLSDDAGLAVACAVLERQP